VVIVFVFAIGSERVRGPGVVSQELLEPRCLLTSTGWLLLAVDVERATTLAYPVKMLWQEEQKAKKMSFF
jgi:hypothetical protein